MGGRWKAGRNQRENNVILWPLKVTLDRSWLTMGSILVEISVSLWKVVGSCGKLWELGGKLAVPPVTWGVLVHSHSVRHIYTASTLCTIAYHLRLHTRMLPVPVFVYWCIERSPPWAVFAVKDRSDYAEHAQQKMGLVELQERIYTVRQPGLCCDK